MQTLDLEAAAKFLYASTDTIRELAASGELPAAKVGRAWVFVDVDLIEWLRTQYGKGHAVRETRPIISTVSHGRQSMEELLALPAKREQKRKTVA